MQRIPSFVLLVLATFVVFLSAACDPEDCPDGSIVIDPDASSGAYVHWQITSSIDTPLGPAPSVVILDDFESTYTVRENESVTVVLIATDNECGIHSVDVTGGFGYSCQEGNGSIIFGSGTFPSNPINYIGSMTCGLPEAAYQVTEFTGSDFCSGPNRTFRGATYSLDGIAQNNLGVLSIIRLTINVNPTEL